jgi:pimeloyl-ACP methyl ester carboxylesterase
MTLQPELRFLDVPGDAQNPEARRIAYWCWGSIDAPGTLLCVHGLTRNGRDFDFLAASLSADYRVFCPDMPGRGQSPYLTDKAGYNNTAYLADLMALLRQENVAHVDWVGTSMGGILGMVAGASMPGLVDRLVLNDVGAHIPREGLLRLGQYVGKSVAFASRQEARSALRAIYAPFGITQEAAWEHLFAHSLKDDGDGKVRLAYDPALGDAFSNPDAIQDVDLQPLWEKITCPVLILRGANSDILTRETAARMQSEKPAQVTYVDIPGTGHAPSLMREEEIHIIRRWLLAE